MIKASELRLGNLAQDQDGNLLQVIGLTFDPESPIKEKSISFYVLDRSKFPLKNGWNAEYIPINQEWAVKFGFVLTADYGDQKHYEHPSLRNFSIVFDHEEIALHHIYSDSYVCVFYDDERFRFIHQLQNFFFSIVGEELVFSTEP